MSTVHKTPDRHALAHRLRQIGERSRADQLLEATDPAIFQVLEREANAKLAESNGDGAGLSAGRHVDLDPAATIRSERVRWLWKYRIPLRGLSVVAGEKGLGKSILTNAATVAKLTRGEMEGELEGQPVDALIASAEDDWASVIKPRLMAHEADLDRVHRVRVTSEHGDSLLTLPDDAPLLERRIELLRDNGHRVGLLVVDPIGAFLSERTDSHRDAPVRRALAPLSAMAERLDLAVIVVAHLTKDEGRKLVTRISGAGAFANAARSVLGFARHPDDPDGEKGHERVLVHAASNWGRYAPSLSAHVESRQIEVDDGSVADVGYLVIGDETDVSVEDLQRGPDESASDTEEMIGKVLDEAGGSLPSSEVKAKVAKELGCARKTVERAGVRLRERGDLKHESGGFPRTTRWTLIDPGDRQDTEADDSRDSLSSPEGTFPNAESVPTDRRDIPTGIPTPSGDSGEPPCEHVPIGGDNAAENTEGELERSRARTEANS